MIYARIQNGFVAELYTPPAGVSITQCFHVGLTWNDVTKVTPAPQVGWVATQTNGAWAYAAPPPPPAPTLAQQAASAISAGLTVTSTSGNWTAVFALDSDAQSHMQAEMIALLNSGGASFADGAATVDWPDVKGVVHTLTTTQGKALFLAAGAFVAGCYKVINGTGTALPPATATIA